MMPDRVVPFPGDRKEAAPVTEDSIAVLVAREHGKDIRWCPEKLEWRLWTKHGWVIDQSGSVFETCRNACRLFTIQTGKDKWGKYSTVSSVEKFLRTQPELVVHAAGWDADPMLLGTPNGIVDLRDGTFSPHRHDNLIVRRTAADPAEDGEEPEQWLAFLRVATRNDPKLIRYLQRLAGYALTGLVKDHALFFVYGPGGNGKGTFLDTVRGIMGDYTIHSPTETFMKNMSGRHPTELAMLHGARLVTASETEEGQEWAESRIKSLTGGDPITARFMNKDFFTFEPTHKLVVIGNHRPVLRNVDAAVRRRLRMIPFKVTPKCIDADLRDKLKEEWPRILRWMINGCLDWQAEDMELPEIVHKETFDYFEDQDAFGQWLTECCEPDKSVVPDEHLSRCMSSRLFASWAKWASANGEKAGTNKAFSEEMVKRGFRKKRGTSGVEFFGISLKAPNPTFEM